MNAKRASQISILQYFRDYEILGYFRPASLLVLLSRESAICYIPIILIISLCFKNFSKLRLLIITLVPLICYFIIRFLLYPFRDNSFFNITFWDTNIFSIFYKILHFFINI